MSARVHLPRLGGYGVSAVRFAISALFAATPTLMMTEMFGSTGKSPSGRWIARHYVLRDLALGAGLLGALRSGRGAAGWMMAGTVADALDLGAIAVAQRDTAKRARLLTGMAAIVTIDAGLTVLLRNDDRAAQTS